MEEAELSEIEEAEGNKMLNEAFSSAQLGLSAGMRDSFFFPAH